MAKLSYFLRKNGKAIEETVHVRHYHQTKDTDFVRTTGVKVAPAYFDTKTGKVSNKLPIAPEWNEAIQRVATDIETASRNLLGKGVHPTKAAMSAEYDGILTERATAVRLRPAADRILGSMLDVLKSDLQDLLEQVELKKKEIEREELILDIHDGKLMSKLIKDYSKIKAATAAVNTTRLYENVSKVIFNFKPSWNIDDVNADTLLELENWLIAQGKRNLTITDTITKVKTVFYHFAKKFKIDTSEVSEHKTNVHKKSNSNVVFLSKEELQDLIDLPLTSKVEQKIRDRFVIMCLAGIRYSDSSITPENVFNDNLLFTTEKTDTYLEVPISGLLKTILAKYDNTIVDYPAQHFNKKIKDICSRIESLQHKVQINNYLGKNKATKTTKKKYNAISAHVGRYTFINLALLRGISPVVIASIVGHEGIDLIMKTYGSKEAGKERIAELMD